MQWSKAVLGLFSFILCLQIVQAQDKIQNTGKLSGVLVNRKTQQNAPGLLVSLAPGGQKMVADSNGGFRFTSLLPGAYAIKTTGVGFQDRLLNNGLS